VSPAAAAPPASPPGTAPVAIAAASPAPAAAPKVADVPAAPSADPDSPAAEPVAPARSKSGAPPVHLPARHRPRPRAAHASAREPTAAPAPAETHRVAAPEATATPVAAELAAPPAAAAPASRELRARVDDVDVTGSLPRGEVARAVDRQWAAIARCLPPAPQTVVAHFTIGETRRAQDVRTSGPTPATNACLTSALAEVRTEQAPDVGDVQVTVRIAFVVKM
jgi:hypothetical protein